MIYTKMERIAPGEKIVNTLDETYNGVNRKSNEVWTHTPENPSIDVEKYTLKEGWEQGAKGDRDTVEQALALSAEGATNGLQIGFTVTNTGDVDLKDVSLSDVTHEGTTGDVSDIMCEIPTAQAGENPAAAGVAGGATTDTVKVAADKIGTLKAGQSIACVGTLTGVEEDTSHADTATVTGKSVYTDKEVSDSDDWNATLTGPTPETPETPDGGKGAVTGEVAGANTGLMAAIGLGGGATWFARRKAHVAAKH